MNRAARRRSRRRLGGLAGMSLVATTGLLGGYLGNPRMPRAYAAATCTVTTEDDNTGAGSLRKALLDHHASDSDCSTINFAPSVTEIILLSNLPAVTSSSLTITGPGSSALTLDLNDFSGFRMFRDVAGDLEGQTLAIRGLTIRDGLSTNKGSAVYSFQNSVSISDVTFTSNASSSEGGAVALSGRNNYGFELNIMNSTFTGRPQTFTSSFGSVKPITKSW